MANTNPHEDSVELRRCFAKQLLDKHRSLEARLRSRYANHIADRELKSRNIMQCAPLSWDPEMSGDEDPSTSFALPMATTRFEEALAGQVPSFAASNIKYSPWNGWHENLSTAERRCNAGAALIAHFARRTEDLRDIDLNLLNMGGWSAVAHDRKFYRRMHLHDADSSYDTKGVFFARDQKCFGSHSFCKLSDGTLPDDTRLLRSEILAAIRLSSDVLARDLAKKNDVPKWAIYPTIVLSVSACHVRILQIHVDLIRDMVVVRKTPFMYIGSKMEEDKIRLVLRWYLSQPTGQTRLITPSGSGDEYDELTDERRRSVEGLGVLVRSSAVGCTA